MMGLSLADWLALREPFDAAARSATLARAVSEALTGDLPLRIVDLGTGRGSNVRFLTGYLSLPQEWLLLDEDAAVLKQVPGAMTGLLHAECAIDLRQVNLGLLDSTMFDGRHLVTASALLDLVSESWLGSLAHHCRAVRAAGLFALTYNGDSRCSPAEPEDDEVRELMNRHQRANDKGFGRAVGPDAVAVAERSFKAVGYRVERAASDWNLPPAAREMQRELVNGWADAASAIAPARSATISGWLRRRHDHIDAGRSQIVVCHEDLIATPG
ncbi:MAG TPA: hypothetical protein VK504_02370 [Vicinamibacterales bacterium]|nr:hypothetical protein [Vicinamibacterales bacterium]